MVLNHDYASEVEGRKTFYVKDRDDGSLMTLVRYGRWGSDWKVEIEELL